jgi:hypothetical protein
MRLRIMATALALGAFGWGPGVVAQTTPDAPDAALLALAYEAVTGTHLPQGGRRVVAVVDPLLRIPAGREGDVELANRRFASLVRLPAVVLADVLRCPTSWQCSFTDSVAATVSVRMASRLQDSAVVHVATRYFLPPSSLRGFAWQALALHQVWLARRNGRWTVVGLSPLAES